MQAEKTKTVEWLHDFLSETLGDNAMQRSRPTSFIYRELVLRVLQNLSNKRCQVDECVVVRS